MVRDFARCASRARLAHRAPAEGSPLVSALNVASAALAIFVALHAPVAAQPRGGWQAPTQGQGFGQGYGQGFGQPYGQGYGNSDRPQAHSFAPTPAQGSSYINNFGASQTPFAPAAASLAPAASPRSRSGSKAVFTRPAAHKAAPERAFPASRPSATKRRHVAPRPRAAVAAKTATAPVLPPSRPEVSLPFIGFTQPAPESKPALEVKPPVNVRTIPESRLSGRPAHAAKPLPPAKPAQIAILPPPPKIVETPIVAPAPQVRPVPVARVELPTVRPRPPQVLRTVIRRPEKARKKAKHRHPGFKGPVFTKQPPNYISPYVATNHTDGPPLDWPPQALKVCDGPEAKRIKACRNLAAAR